MADCLGLLRQLMGPEWGADLDERACVDWADVATAQCRPELAWVWHPGAVYVRLPATWGNVRAMIAVRRAVALDGNWQELHTVPGQLLWATRQLRTAMASGAGDTHKRWKALLEFIKREWPEWSDALQPRSANVGRPIIEAYLELLEKYAIGLQIAHVGLPLTKWTREGDDRPRLYPVLDAIAYMTQGVPREPLLRSLVTTDRWWTELLADVSAIREQLQSLSQVFADSNDVLSHVLINLEEAVRQFSGLLTAFVAEAGTVPAGLYQASQEILGALDTLDEEAIRLRADVAHDATMTFGEASRAVDSCRPVR